MQVSRLVIVFLVLATGVILPVATPQPVAAQIVGPLTLEPVFVGESAPLTELAAAFAAADPAANLREEMHEVVNHKVGVEEMLSSGERRLAGDDPVRQTVPSATAVPPPLLSFDGTDNDDNIAVLGFPVAPPDTQGDVGRKHFVQMNNLVFEIFDKKTGASVLGPLPNNILFTGTGTLCEATNSGDPIVLYDHHRKRWILTQFALFDSQLRGHECLAISKTSDPLGEYLLYDYPVSEPVFGGIAALNDYPKLTVWIDGIYMTVNEFEFSPGIGFRFIGASVAAFDKEALYAGEPAVGVKFVLPLAGSDTIPFGLQASHWEGNPKPRKGQPNTVFQEVDAQAVGGPGDGYLHWDFAPDFKNPSQSTFTPLGLIPAPEFDDNLCNFARNCIDQPPPGTRAEGRGLDSLDINTMYRAQWRRFGGGDDEGDDDEGGGDDDEGDDGDGGNFQSVVLNHSVDVDGNDTAGVRWVELRNSGDGWAIHQTGTFAPADGNSRWMGSIAQDKAGNIALGYSVSGLATFPSVRYTGRSAGDPLGQMGAEQECQAGTGSQIGTNRWGDYSTMSVDPQDGCTFFYTQEYYESTSSFSFKTRICAFKFDNCQGDD